VSVQAPVSVLCHATCAVASDVLANITFLSSGLLPWTSLWKLVLCNEICVKLILPHVI
jgi:hypothetical protein